MIIISQTIVISVGTAIRHEEQVAASRQHLWIIETHNVGVGKIKAPLQHAIMHEQDMALVHDYHAL